MFSTLYQNCSQIALGTIKWRSTISLVKFSLLYNCKFYNRDPAWIIGCDQHITQDSRLQFHLCGPWFTALSSILFYYFILLYFYSTLFVKFVSLPFNLPHPHLGFVHWGGDFRHHDWIDFFLMCYILSFIGNTCELVVFVGKWF